jgi:hypothetical protein
LTSLALRRRHRADAGEQCTRGSQHGRPAGGQGGTDAGGDQRAVADDREVDALRQLVAVPLPRLVDLGAEALVDRLAHAPTDRRPGPVGVRADPARQPGDFPLGGVVVEVDLDVRIGDLEALSHDSPARVFDAGEPRVVADRLQRGGRDVRHRPQRGALLLGRQSSSQDMPDGAVVVRQPRSEGVEANAAQRAEVVDPVEHRQVRFDVLEVVEDPRAGQCPLR